MKNEKWLSFMREQFPEGSRVKIEEMVGSHPTMKPGETGELKSIDDSGRFLVALDNGNTLALVPGEDSFSILPPEPRLLKLYMPMAIGYWDEDGQDGTLLDDQEAVRCADTVAGALHREEHPEEADRGMMYYYGKDDGINRKVHSYHFTAEARDGKLWGVAECMVIGHLTLDELESLKEDVSGQASDGFGEGFEQRPIDVGGRELYAHLWQWDNWDIRMEQELFGPKLAEDLPELCFSVLPGEGKLICIRRGEMGYYHSDWETGDPVKNRELADYNNKRLGVSKAQEEAMLTGSMHGWACPGADPKTWEGQGQKMKGL